MKMKMISWAALFFASTSTFADSTPPPNFQVKDVKAVFVDFRKAHYEITYDYAAKRATVVSTIDFYASEAGHPVFDLLPAPRSIELNGKSTTQSLVQTPGKETTLRMVGASVEAGANTMKIVSTLSHKVTYGWSGVTSFFSIRDLKERKFIEQYIPTNLEYDQVPMTFEVKFLNMRAPNQEFMANGTVTELAKNHYLIQYPEYYTASSPFYHTFPRGKMAKRTSILRSISGKDIPIITYKNFFIYNLRKFQKKTHSVINELERDYGPYAHDAVYVFAKGLRGGMEHSGGTETSYVSLGHEIFHFYFAKGVMPANGNAGWIDEAFASWRDRGYPRLDHPGYETSNMGGKSPYVRQTDGRAYSQGMRFIAYLDGKLAPAGGMKKFMRELFASRVHTLLTVGEFQSALEKFSGLDLQEDFDRYVLGKYGPGAPDKSSASESDESTLHNHSVN